MNIKSFLEWRPQCFFCGEKLFIQPDFPNYPCAEGEKAGCTIEDESIHWVSRYINLSIDIISGLVHSTDNSVDTVAFIARQDLHILAKCLWCPPNGRIYSHIGMFHSDETRTHYLFEDLIEKLVVNKAYLVQTQSVQSGTVRGVAGGDLKYPRTLAKEGIEIPYIDLFKATPEKLSNKIKTYITFS